MTISTELSAFAHRLRLADVEPRLIAQCKTLIIDAVACALAGASSKPARIALKALERMSASGAAVVIARDRRSTAAGAALANGAMLRSLDLMDVYVSADVCHPSEAVPTAIACAEAAGATGAEFLEAVIAGYTLHFRLADTIALHRNGLHHAGHAAWVAPLIAGKLFGVGETVTASALGIAASRLILPEGFARGQVTNMKAMAYPLLAAQGIEALLMARDGVAGPPGACEEVVDILRARFNMALDADQVVPDGPATDLFTTSLKSYPAQYALQGLIAAASEIHSAGKVRPQDIVTITVHTSSQTAQRTGDASKFRPGTPEAADHSLPFCVAVALIDGTLTHHALESGRWRDGDVLALMDRLTIVPSADSLGYQVGRQEIKLRLVGGGELALDCAYPPRDSSWDTIARQKLRDVASARFDAEAIICIVEALENEDSLSRLTKALA